jgi:Mrp family chromosome partitioning ATPase
MSRYYELMQDTRFEVIESPKAAATNAPAHAAPTVSASVSPGVNESEASTASAAKAGRPLEMDHTACEEALKLVQRIFLAQTQEEQRMVAFAAVDKGGGCSQIVARVAESLTNNVRGSICVVEANLRSPSLPSIFGTTNHYGLTDAVLKEGPIRTFTKPLYSDNLWLLSSGSLTGDSTRLFHSERLKARLCELRKEFDYVVIDAPPLARYADAVTLGQISDGLVLVLEAHATRREVAQSIASNLQAAKVKVLGAVLNKRTYPIPEAIYRKV